MEIKPVCNQGLNMYLGMAELLWRLYLYICSRGTVENVELRVIKHKISI